MMTPRQEAALKRAARSAIAYLGLVITRSQTPMPQTAAIRRELIEALHPQYVHRSRAASDEALSGKTKRCPLCKTPKPIEDFNRNNKAADGRQGYCRRCSGGYSQDRSKALRAEAGA